VSEPDEDSIDDYEPADLVQCPRCNGLGEISLYMGFEIVACPECNGEGRVEP
jgi:DnaJ-class molecular chaperone